MKRGIAALAAFLAACSSTPYKPDVVIKDSKPFAGITQLLANAPDKRVDVILVHGMCTHKQQWALETITMLARAAEQSTSAAKTGQTKNIDGIEIVSAESSTPDGTIYFSAFIWSGLTAPGKATLAYDLSGTPTNCATDDACRPVRATLNARLKDTLMNDCLSDALIYQGESKAAINQAFINAITQVTAEQASRNAGKTVPLVLISESLGSKMTFDALNLMAGHPADSSSKRAGDDAIERISYLYMGANQLPILSLADRSATLSLLADGKRDDALNRLLSAQKTRSLVPKITVVAFTDPNDQLSWWLQPANYSNKAAIANVLVSNDKTYFGYLENPYTAHTTYLENDDVTRAIMCGMPASPQCK